MNKLDLSWQVTKTLNYLQIFKMYNVSKSTSQVGQQWWVHNVYGCYAFISLIVLTFSGKGNEVHGSLAFDGMEQIILKASEDWVQVQ